MDISPELKEWLEKRDQYLTFKIRLAADGGHVMLRDETYIPEALNEPLRTEALAYFESLSNKD